MIFDGFFARAEHLSSTLQANERLLFHLSGEASDYVRFNRAKVRQAGGITNQWLTLTLIRGEVEASISTDHGHTLDAMKALLNDLRAMVDVLPSNPHLLLPDTARHSTRNHTDTLPTTTDMVDTILSHADGLDYVGILVSGTMFSAFADSSTGQRNTFSRASFHLDASIVEHADKAVKLGLAGPTFDSEVIRQQIEEARHQLPLLARDEKVVPSGDYRALLLPDAVGDAIGLAARGGFSKSAVERSVSPMMRAYQGELLSEQVHLYEDTSRGLGPAFDDRGFLKPDRTRLLDGGRPDQLLVSPKSAREFSVQTTGANAWEHPSSLTMDPGTLPMADALDALGTGLLISNLHYLNFSDLGRGSMTGLTRFASHWVQDGVIVAPLRVMRFDDDVFRMFGTELEALTDTAELQPSNRTYLGRSTNSVRCPGALLKRFRLTL